ncbi:GNAT family N-acetyltransferase [Candidatus Kaiserbacteria bacterium]|nr:GNAT family N-acetyltransferase [Candidatus Kaiserbacteria bacterium]
MHNPFLIGERIYLRTIEETDLNATYREWFNDEEVCRFNSHHRFPNYDQDMRRYYDEVIKSRSNLILAICHKETDTHVGNIALENIDPLNQSAEFAILIGDKEWWSKGIGRDASHLIIKHGFSALHLHRIYCGTQEDNLGMQKLADKLGFVKEGVSRDTIFKDGRFRNTISYGLLRDEYETT